MRHIVAMRFCSWNANPNVDYMRPEIIETVAETCRKYTMKSLLNMKNKGFEPVFMVHPKKNVSLLGPMVPCAADLGATIVRADRFDEFCERVRGKDDLIVTRCDADDLYADWLVDDIQEKASNPDFKRPFVYGYNRGLLYRDGTNVLRLFEKDYGIGHFSAFQSSVFGSDERLKNITPYSWKHYNIATCSKLRENFDTKEILKMVVNGDNGNPPFVYVRTGTNASKDTQQDDLKYPETHRFGRDYMMKTFGVDLPIA